MMKHLWKNWRACQCRINRAIDLADPLFQSLIPNPQSLS